MFLESETMAYAAQQISGVFTGLTCEARISWRGERRLMDVGKVIEVLVNDF